MNQALEEMNQRQIAYWLKKLNEHRSQAEEQVRIGLLTLATRNYQAALNCQDEIFKRAGIGQSQANAPAAPTA